MAKINTPYQAMYWTDYDVDTPHFNCLDHGAYMMLIKTYWQRGKPLPMDDEYLAAVCRATPEQWASVKQKVMTKFAAVNNHWVHPRIERDLRAVQDKIDQAKRAGKASGVARAGKPKLTVVQRPFNARSTDDER
jgi:uncharacterized protein YdaU (DUF1376 family)